MMIAARKAYGKLLAETRKSKQQTQAEISNLTDIPRVTISAIERGQFTGSLRILERYAEYLGFIITIKLNDEDQYPSFDELPDLFKDVL